MKVQVMIGATAAYAAITGTKDNGGFYALDVKLPAGKGAKAGLMERAADYQKQAERAARYARICRDAAYTFED